MTEDLLDVVEQRREEEAEDTRPRTKSELVEAVIAGAIRDGVIKADGEENLWRFRGRQFSAVVFMTGAKGPVLR